MESSLKIEIKYISILGNSNLNLSIRFLELHSNNIFDALVIY